MARLYLFAVGGTGARVLRALTHLLGAGATLRDYNGQPMELVPLVVDPDADNGDTLDCLKTLVTYSDLRGRYLEPGGYPRPAERPVPAGGFLGAKISRYQELRAEAQQADRPGAGAQTVIERESFRCGIVDRERNQTFGSVIGYDYLKGGTRLIVDALYSPENLDTKLSGGFLGNPNLGTVVLNRVKGSEQFRMLPGLFHSEDRIFIISSIFGGTGASGFPVLVKLLRDAKDEAGHVMDVLRKGSIGALSVLPYFAVESDARSPIDSNAFVPKTKAALAYYADHLDGIQALYYIGDRARKQYANRPTGPLQSNQDHIVEFIGATAVLHFARHSGPEGQRSQFLECAVADRDETQALDLTSVGDELLTLVGPPLTAFAMASRFLQQATQPAVLARLLAQPWSKDGGFDRKFFAVGSQSMPYNAVQEYSRLWWDSLGQMAANVPSFQPFGDGLIDLRKDRATTTLDTNDVNMALNLLHGEFGPKSSVKRLLQMLWAACGQIAAERYGAAVASA